MTTVSSAGDEERLASIIARLRSQAQLGFIGLPADHQYVSFHDAAEALADVVGALSASNTEAERLRSDIAQATDLMRKAHAVMRECGWQLAAGAETSGDGILEAACSELEADFREFLASGSAALEAYTTIERLKALVEQAFRDGLTYATNVDVTDPDAAWQSSRIRAALSREM